MAAAGALALVIGAALGAAPAAANTPKTGIFPTDPMPPLAKPFRLPPIVLAKVDKSEQRMRVYVNGKPVYSWRVSTARGGYITPTGSWRPTRIHKMWHSRKYNMAPMPYSVFYYRGYAVHGTYDLKRLGRPASHGCVRLHPGNAKKLYQLVARYGMANTQIVVTH
ncbi:MAG: hypothetical protein Kow0032_28300 [Methyloligellaceae bacterium]